MRRTVANRRLVARHSRAPPRQLASSPHRPNQRLNLAIGLPRGNSVTSIRCPTRNWTSPRRSVQYKTGQAVRLELEPFPYSKAYAKEPGRSSEACFPCRFAAISQLVGPRTVAKKQWSATLSRPVTPLANLTDPPRIGSKIQRPGRILELAETAKIATWPEWG